MESAIPKHLKCPRSRTRRIPDDYKPSYPAWVARHPESVKQVVMAYFGVQTKGGDPTKFLSWLADEFAKPDGPGHWDRARYKDEVGFENVVSIAYWDDLEKYQRWSERNEFRDWWESADREKESFGYFREILRPRAEQFETLFSTQERKEGVAVLAPELSGEIQEHAYWGGVRDRIPLSQTHSLEPRGVLTVRREGKRVRVRPHGNLCLIRSGQDWSATTGPERQMYLQEIEPILREAMDYLRDSGLPIGCYCNRYMTVVDGKGHDTEKSFGMGFFRSLGELERWSESHPTHVAIFGTFMRIVQKLNFDLKLRLYHEVSVVDAEDQIFEYINCHEATGLQKLENVSR